MGLLLSMMLLVSAPVSTKGLPSVVNAIPTTITMPPPDNHTSLPYTNPDPDGVWYGGVHVTPNTNVGIRSTFNVISTSVTGGDCYTVWVAEQLSNNDWGQVGWFNCGGSYSTFDQNWDLGTDTIIGSNTTSFGASIGDNNTYTMEYSGSGGIWNYYVNSTLVGSCNFGASTSGTSYPTYVVGEVQDPSSSFSVNTDTVSIAVQTYSGSVWTSASTATAYLTSGSSANVEGAKQNAALRNNYVLIGTSVADPAVDSAVLWPGSGGGDFAASFTPVISLTPSISQALNHIIVSASLSLSSSITQTLHNTVSASLSLVSSINQGLKVTISSSLSLSSSLSVLWEGGYIESISILESLTPSITQGLRDTVSSSLSLSPSLSTVLGAAYSATLSVLENLSPSSIGQSLGGILQSYSTTLIPNVQQFIGNSVSASISLSDSLKLAASSTLSPVITIVLSLGGMAAYQVTLNLLESLGPVINQGIVPQTLSPFLILNPSIIPSAGVLESMIINLHGTFSTLFNGGYYETFSVFISLVPSLGPYKSIAAICLVFDNTSSTISSAVELLAVGLIVTAAVGLAVAAKWLGGSGSDAFGDGESVTNDMVLPVIAMSVLLIVGTFIIFAELGVFTSILGCSI